MSDIKKHSDIFKNEMTRRRRAWVESALEIAKSYPRAAENFQLAESETSQKEVKRHLYVAYSDGRRRTGS